MNGWLYFPIAVAAIGSLLTVTTVGKPRNPITAGTAAAVVAVNLAIVVCLLKASCLL